MSDRELRCRLVETLCARRKIISITASITDLRQQLGLTRYSNTQFKRALGSAIQDGLVVRRRPPGVCIGDDDRPVTLEATRRALCEQSSVTMNSPYMVK